MAVKTQTTTLNLTKYNPVDMPEALNVLSENMDKIDDYATGVETWRGTVDNEIEELSRDIDLLNPAEITALENKVNTNAANIASLNSEVNGLRTRITSAESRLSSIEAEQTVQNNRLDNIDGSIVTINGSIGALSGELDNLEDDLTNYKNVTNAKISDIEGDIADLKTEDETFSQQLLHDATELADHETRIDALEQAGIPAGVLERITALETASADHESRIITLEGQIAQAISDISGLASDVSALQSDMTSVQGDITQLLSDVTSILSRVSSIEDTLVAGVNTTSGLGIYAADDPNP